MRFGPWRPEMRRLTVHDPVALLNDLQHAVERTGDSRQLHRLHCVCLVSQGCSCYDVARWFFHNPRTVERWVHEFEREGPDGLKDRNRRGRPPGLTNVQLSALRCDLQSERDELGHPTRAWSGKALQIYLRQQFGLRLSVRQAQRVLKRLRQDM